MTPTLTAAACAEHEAERSRQLASDPVSVLIDQDPAIRNVYNAFLKGLSTHMRTIGTPRDWTAFHRRYFAEHRLACLANGLDVANTPLLTVADMEGLSIPAAPPDERAWEANWLALPTEPRVVATIKAIFECNIEVGLRLELARDPELHRNWWACSVTRRYIPFDIRPHLNARFKRRSEAERVALTRVVARLYRGAHPFVNTPDDTYAAEIVKRLADMAGFDKRGREIDPPAITPEEEAA